MKGVWDMNVEISIDPLCREPKIIIYTDKMTTEIEHIMRNIFSTEEDTLPVLSNKGVELIHCEDIIRLYTEQKKVLVQTADNLFTIRLRMYELEAKLNSQMFVRISNAEIVNRKKIKYMDISKTGTIGVFLEGNVKTFASRRYVAKIKKQLGI